MPHLPLILLVQLCKNDDSKIWFLLKEKKGCIVTWLVELYITYYNLILLN